MLKGNWPASVPDRLRTDLAALDPAAAGSEAARRARHAIVGEGLFALQAGEVVEKARTLDPAKRYDALAAWVLPGPDHPLVRLEGDFTPTFPAKVTGEAGGTLRSPAVELVKTAKEFGRLDALAAAVRDGKVGGDDPMSASQRGRLAMLAMIAAARGDEAAAGKSLEALRTAIAALPVELEEWARWPELAAADAALGRPGLSPSAKTIAELLADRARSGPSRRSASRRPPACGTSRSSTSCPGRPGPTHRSSARGRPTGSAPRRTDRPGPVIADDRPVAR